MTSFKIGVRVYFKSQYCAFLQSYIPEYERIFNRLDFRVCYSVISIYNWLINIMTKIIHYLGSCSTFLTDHKA